MRGVRDHCIQYVRVLIEVYGCGRSAEAFEEFVDQCWDAMRFLCEEATRRTLMGLRTLAKREAMAKVVGSLCGTEALMIPGEKFALWRTLPLEVVRTMVMQIEDGTTSPLRNPSILKVGEELMRGASAEFLSLRNPGDVSDQRAVWRANLLTAEDQRILLEEDVAMAAQGVDAEYEDVYDNPEAGMPIVSSAPAI